MLMLFLTLFVLALSIVAIGVGLLIFFDDKNYISGVCLIGFGVVIMMKSMLRLFG